MSKMMYMDTQYAGVTPEKDFSDLIDFFYPVGCYFETSDEDFDPNISWSGTWIQETAGQVHVSAGTGYSVSGALTNTSDGGNKDAIIPYHNHTASGGSVGGNPSAYNTNSSGAVTNGVPSAGTHYHTAHYTSVNRGSGSTATRVGPYSRDTYAGNHVATGDAGAHTHNLPNHTHSIPASSHTHNFTQPTISYAGTNGNTVDANMQPYINVYRWHRTA